MRFSKASNFNEKKIMKHSLRSVTQAHNSKLCIFNTNIERFNKDTIECTQCLNFFLYI